jgi:hypothetical protein
VPGSSDSNRGNLNKAGSASSGNVSFYRDLYKETRENQAFLASEFRNHWETPFPHQGFSDSETENLILDS